MVRTECRRPTRRLCCFGASPSSPVEVSPSDSVSSLLPEEYAGFGIDTSFARDIFTVSVWPTQTSERLKLRGELQLVIFSYGVGLAKARKSECFLVWPVAHIRQYQLESLSGGSRAMMVTLDVGRRSSTGEGTFQFKSHRGSDIIQELKKIVEMWSERKTLLSIHRTHSKHNVNEGASTSNCHRPLVTGGSGCVAPCIPSLAFPRPWQKHWPVPQHKRASRENKGAIPKAGCSKAMNDSFASDTEINYIVPKFEDDDDDDDDNYLSSEDSDEKTDFEAKSKPKPMMSPDLSPFKRVRVARKVRRGRSQTPPKKQVSAKVLAGQVMAEGGSSSNSDDNCYVEIVRGKVPTIVKNKVVRTQPKKGAGKLPSKKNEEDYIEVLPT